MRGIRGATTVADNTCEAISSAVAEMVTALQEANGFALEDVAGAYFTATQDLDATFPAMAARQLGWDLVPLMCAVEMDVPGSLKRCIRVLVLVNTTSSQADVRHVYLRGARTLRPDLA